MVSKSSQTSAIGFIMPSVMYGAAKRHGKAWDLCLGDGKPEPPVTVIKGVKTK